MIKKKKALSELISILNKEFISNLKPWGKKKIRTISSNFCMTSGTI